LSESQIYNACIPVETKEGVAGSGSRAPMNEQDAKAYAGFVCRMVSRTCAASPTKDPCPKDLKRYGLAP
jgi:hypothetical protein